MKFAKLGKSDVQVSAITFGCWEMGGAQWEFTNDQNNITAVHKALDLGITSFDTAEGYGNGHSEEILGVALEGSRKDIFLATKVAPNHLAPADVRAAAVDSLKRLKTDYIDLYYMHWPNFSVPIEDTMGELVKLQKEGLIRFIGASNFKVDLLTQASAVGRIDAIQPEYSLLHRGIEAEILPWCLENEVSVLSYSSIAKGILTGIFHFGGVKIKDDDFRSNRRLFSADHFEKEKPLLDVVKQIADAKEVSLSQVAIAWLLAKEGMTSAIVGTQNEKHLIDNVDSAEVSLSADEVAKLDEVSMDVLFSIDGNLGEIQQPRR
jgi:aryl-alcohol dehydrogenase-like predicted oxidoreductase